ncbi:MAG: peptidoglycan editing factor PgeF [Candidatus Paracaedibacteraceae bacterium]|nr:peptidoglycan editing factor PgeF [Candidatus Paracaedibacteraceae bacterium]
MPPHLKASNLNDIPWLKHGFFGRKGGVSEGEFESLNISLQKGDLPQNVLKNKQFMASALLMESAPVVLAYQKHTNIVKVIDAPFGEDIPIADALVTRQKNLLIGVQTADCVPVIFVDPFTKIIAAAHAGWKGLADGILQNTINVMLEMGANKKNIKTAIGPCIWSESYEVGSDVVDSFPQFSDLFKLWELPSCAEKEKKTYSFDLPMAVYRTLQSSEISCIDASSVNTYAQEDDYFSFRRSTHKRHERFGGQASLIGIIK